VASPPATQTTPVSTSQASTRRKFGASWWSRPSKRSTTTGATDLDHDVRRGEAQAALVECLRQRLFDDVEFVKPDFVRVPLAAEFEPDGRIGDVLANMQLPLFKSLLESATRAFDP
jgi:hypothetical protein